jgi:Phage Mu protein F like protein
MAKPTKSEIAAILAEGWNDLPDVIGPVFEDAATDTSAEVIVSAGLVPTEDQWNYVDEATTDLAWDRAGELVGMQWDEDAQDWVENPDAEWAITEDVRDELTGLVAKAEAEEWSSDQLSDAIQNAQLFSEDRAETIARTELKRIDAMSADSTAKRTGASKKRWLLSSDHNEDDDCDNNNEDGWIDIDDDFSSGADLPPEHPNCQCVVTFGWEDGDSGSETTDSEETDESEEEEE